MGVFACGWLGLGVCATARVRLWCLRALVCALAWGWWDNHCPAAPAPLAWLVLTLWCGLEKRVRGGVCPMGGGRQVGRDMVVPPHTLLGGTVPARYVHVEERRVGVLPGVVNTRAQREGGGATGRAIAGTGGGGVRSWWWRWRAHSLGTYKPHPDSRGRLNLAYVGTLASVRAIVAWAGAGWASPLLGGGVGLVVTISLGSVKGA